MPLIRFRSILLHAQPPSSPLLNLVFVVYSATASPTVDEHSKHVGGLKEGQAKNLVLKGKKGDIFLIW